MFGGANTTIFEHFPCERTLLRIYIAVYKGIIADVKNVEIPTKMRRSNLRFKRLFYILGYIVPCKIKKSPQLRGEKGYL